jgi:hydrogenase expression/formation protein HypD
MSISISEKIKILSVEMEKISKVHMNLMEVCGTHTMSIAKYGLRSMLPKNVHIISGPGCPVCVTSAGEIELAINLANKMGKIVATFGDMIKVPGAENTLGDGDNVKIIYNPLEAITLAKENPDRDIVLLGIGFETTTPLIGATIKVALQENLTNFFVLPMHKLVPPALEVLLSDKENEIHGFILPGHVSAITGRRYYKFLDKYEINGVIAGFEPLEIMESIYILIKNFNEKKYEIVNNYKNVVTENGNEKAFNMIGEIFEPCDSEWRGIGVIPQSGLKLKAKYEHFDVCKKFNLEIPDIKDPKECLCGLILMGKKKPHECIHFGKRCNPGHPIGPCMVSSEGTCAAYYKYNL